MLVLLDATRAYATLYEIRANGLRRPYQETVFF